MYKTVQIVYFNEEDRDLVLNNHLANGFEYIATAQLVSKRDVSVEIITLKKKEK